MAVGNHLCQLKKVLQVHLPKLNKHVYVFARDMYEMLIKWEGVDE